jgi:uncharacterized protein YfdQ (DUF2303 family)
MTDRTEADAVAEVVRDEQAILPRVLTAGDLFGVVVPRGRTFEIHDLEKYAETPNRKRGTARFHRDASFSAYVTAHGDVSTTVYGDVTKTELVAVLNGHIPNDPPDSDGIIGVGEPGWGDHRAVLKLRSTPAWDRWMKNSGELMMQAEFGQFLEDSVDDIREPSAADLIELSRTFEATKGVTFKGAHRPVSGQRILRYEETVEARAGQSGEIVIPEVFVLALMPFEGADFYAVKAKFRYRISGGNVGLGYELDRPELVVENAFGDVVDAVQESTGREILHGSPAS